ncbi:MAG: dodecin family protein [Dethiobacteria bacterium]|jgi:flavin-binding protein dodecin|nr:dodecin domain-containing protein [Bacillota bacterium]
MAVAKVIELVGESDKGWQDAVQNALNEASKTIDNITGIEVTNMTANVNYNQIVEYKVNIKLAFGVHEQR